MKNPFWPGHRTRRFTQKRKWSMISDDSGFKGSPVIQKTFRTKSATSVVACVQCQELLV